MTYRCRQWRRQLWDTGERAPSPSTFNNFILVHLNLLPTIQVCVVRLPAEWLAQMSTTQSSFDQYCISHKTISHAAPGPEVFHDIISASPLLATNPGDATGRQLKNTVGVGQNFPPSFFSPSPFLPAFFHFSTISTPPFTPNSLLPSN